MFPLFIYCTLPTHGTPGALSCCYLWFKALFSLHDMSFFHHYVYDTGVCCLRADEQLHPHDTVQDGVQRHKEGMAFHQCDESVTCLAAPLVSKDDGMGWRMHSNNLELMSLIPQQNICLFLFVQFHFEKTNVYKFSDKCVPSLILLPEKGETEAQKATLWGCYLQQLLCSQSPRRTPAKH